MIPRGPLGPLGFYLLAGKVHSGKGCRPEFPGSKEQKGRESAGLGLHGSHHRKQLWRVSRQSKTSRAGGRRTQMAASEREPPGHPTLPHAQICMILAFPSPPSNYNVSRHYHNVKRSCLTTSSISHKDHEHLVEERTFPFHHAPWKILITPEGMGMCPCTLSPGTK